MVEVRGLWLTKREFKLKVKECAQPSALAIWVAIGYYDLSDPK